MVFCHWLLSRNIMFWRFIHIAACVNTAFLFIGIELLGIELLSYMVPLWSTIWETAEHFFKEAVPFYIPTNNVRGFQFLHIFTITCCFPSFFIVAILVDVKWHPTVVLICIFLWLMMLSIFSCAYWPFVYLSWRNVYSDYLSIYKRVLCLFIIEL